MTEVLENDKPAKVQVNKNYDMGALLYEDC